MMRVLLICDRDMILNRTFDHIDILARTNAGPVADAKDMCVDRL